MVLVIGLGHPQTWPMQPPNCPKLKPVRPSSLVPNWRKRIGLAGHTGNAEAPTSEPETGGLSDEDAFAKRPKLLPNTCDTSRQNMSVHIDSEPEETPSKIKKARKASIYLPTLYDFLTCSKTPWIHFTKDEDYLPYIQHILAICYPAFDYRVKLGERLAVLTVKRTQENGSKYANNPTAIASYAKWATRFDGPALWRVPSPRECTDPTVFDYEGPIGFFESKFIIKIFGLFLKATKGSKGDFGDPSGALAMSASAVERAFLMYHSGYQVDCGAKSAIWAFFSEGVCHHKWVPEIVDFVCPQLYLKDIHKLTPRRWNMIMEKSGLQTQPPTTVAPNQSSLQERRGNLYTPSSPIPEPDKDD
ncbi:hypothetical protein BJ138DRAFT_1107036 [Hygrophoropsis aurantiaca]|uniref:Uncharacterized protein n=1 Tax=Hygrophoropsis aurantiaca TaxID=72124 RepID=A0ACB7ZU08_9AGAM|nr:hypothetical protein BJ138DRAFT_1107036 [Hygrophoropsis aurantiaca]